MLNRFVSTRVLTIAFLSLTAGVAFGATQGTEGSTSSGSADLSLTPFSTIKVTGLTDLTVVHTPGAGATVSDSDICVQSSALNYKVTANSVNGTGTFRLESVASDDIIYNVNWDDGTSNEDLNDNAASTSNFLADTDPACGTTTATLTVTVSEAEIIAEPTGVAYTDTLQITVTPQ